MKIYLVTRKDEASWDEYVSWVVVAKSPLDARKFIAKQYEEISRYSNSEINIYSESNLKAKEITSADKREVVLEAYKAE